MLGIALFDQQEKPGGLISVHLVEQRSQINSDFNGFSCRDSFIPVHGKWSALEIKYGQFNDFPGELVCGILTNSGADF